MNNRRATMSTIWKPLRPNRRDSSRCSLVGLLDRNGLPLQCWLALWSYQEMQQWRSKTCSNYRSQVKTKTLDQPSGGVSGEVYWTECCGLAAALAKCLSVQNTRGISIQSLNLFHKGHTWCNLITKNTTGNVDRFSKMKKRYGDTSHWYEYSMSQRLVLMSPTLGSGTYMWTNRNPLSTPTWWRWKHRPWWEVFQIVWNRIILA